MDSFSEHGINKANDGHPGGEDFYDGDPNPVSCPIPPPRGGLPGPAHRSRSAPEPWCPAASRRPRTRRTNQCGLRRRHDRRMPESFTLGSGRTYTLWAMKTARPDGSAMGPAAFRVCEQAGCGGLVSVNFVSAMDDG